MASGIDRFEPHRGPFERYALRQSRGLPFEAGHRS
jgi:hypothetical protein